MQRYGQVIYLAVKYKYNMKKIFLAFAVLVSVNSFAQSYTPSVKLTAGKKYMVTTANKGSISQEAMGQTMEIPMDIAMYNTLNVQSAGATGTQLASTSTRVAFSMNMMGQDVSYDSDKKEDREGQMGDAMKNLVNQTVTFKIDATGKIIEGSVEKPVLPKEETAAGNPLLGMLGLSETALGASPAINLFNSAATIKIGESFTDTSSTSDADSKIKNTITYTLAEVKDGAARFTIAGTTLVEKAMEMQGMQSNTKTSSKLTGEMLVDVATGLLMKKTINSALTGNTEVAGMTIPQTGNMVITITVTEIK